MARYTVTTRSRGAVARSACATLGEALDVLAGEVGAAGTPRVGAATAFVREVAPEAQVLVRVELAGPRVRAGVDVRGDGSHVAYTGRWRRREVVPDGRETAVQALRRALGA